MSRLGLERRGYARRLDRVFNHSVACLVEGSPVGFLSKQEKGLPQSLPVPVAFAETGVCGV